MSETREIRVGVRELRGNLSRYLNEARDGASVLVTSHEAVIAEIRAPSPHQRSPRRFGRLKGRIHIPDDFNTLPDDILDVMEHGAR